VKPTRYYKKTGEVFARIKIEFRVTANDLVSVLANEACLIGLDALDDLTKQKAEEIVRSHYANHGGQCIDTHDDEGWDEAEKLAEEHARRLWPEWFKKINV
jgi:hypothetical protein